MAQIALAWIASRPGVSAPIVGTTSLENLADLIGSYFHPFLPSTRSDKGDNAAGLDVKLTEEEVKELEEPYQAQKVYGHW